MIIGIDFGTCYSSAAIMVKDKLHIVKNPISHNYSFPSSIYIKDNGEILVGGAAENMRKKDPSRYKREFKRELGQNIPYRMGDQYMLPEQLVAEILKKLKSEAEKIYGEIVEVVITVPATYKVNIGKKRLMIKAAEAVGFKKVELLEEPVAAAIYYETNISIKKGQVLLVYDLGGGTFDVALVKKKEIDYEILGVPVGLEYCGGIDFDKKIYQDIKRKIGNHYVKILESNEVDIESLRTKLILGDFCKEIKHVLSEEKEVDNTLTLMSNSIDYMLTREEFNKMIKEMLQETCDISKEIVIEAGLKIEDVSGILMVGGSCRIPYVKKMLEESLKRPVFQVEDLELAICQGAAIYGSKLRGATESTKTTRTTENTGTTGKRENIFEFETVKVDSRGNIIERKKGQANQYIEDLGNGIKLEMVEIPAGSFLMGSPSSEASRSGDEGPQHQVTVPKFYIGKYQVTQKQYQVIMGNNPSYFKGDNLPVECVTWHNAVEFCKKLSAKTGKAYRLPSEAEWEYAARAGTTSPFAFGESINPSIVNYAGNHPYGQAPKGEYRAKTIAVGSLGVANAFGLYDCHGNVWEWCQDIWHDSYKGAPTNGSVWEDNSGNNTYRVLRGGSWSYDGDNCRSANRSRNAPDSSNDNGGVRLCFGCADS